MSEEAEWTEGVCSDGAAILRDGQMVPISELLLHLNACELLSISISNADEKIFVLNEEIERLREALDDLFMHHVAGPTDAWMMIPKSKYEQVERRFKESLSRARGEDAT